MQTDWKPTLYMPLHVQQAPAIQRALFAAEPVAPKCPHPELTPHQRDLFGADVRLCVACGERVR
jgi:hypothetical protein